LDSRVLIEQAKGMLAAQADLDVDQAFSRLRDHARGHNMLLSCAAREFVEGTLTAGSIGLAFSR
jgi:AmiR/NasT family two-component response regulator